MSRKTFISYKYSEASELRDTILSSMGKDATYYKGETSDSPDLSDKSNDYIKDNLKQLIHDTSVTIVILSPNMRESNWIEWEVRYSLKKIKRNDRTSRRNGVVGVIQKANGDYSWFINSSINCHGNSSNSFKMEKIPEIIRDNHFNSDPAIWHCDLCKAYDPLNGSYIAFVREEDFLLDPQKYIENAYDKSLNEASGYSLCIGS